MWLHKVRPLSFCKTNNILYETNEKDVNSAKKWHGEIGNFFMA